MRKILLLPLLGYGENWNYLYLLPFLDYGETPTKSPTTVLI
jgi:hypothetical protein